MYSSRVRAQKQRNPCLSDLYEYLCQPGPARHRSRIVCSEFFEHLESPTTRYLSVQDLHGELTGARPIQGPAGLSGSDRKGRIFLVEDASRHTIEELGTVFDIDPWFFASYIHRTWRKTSTQDPSSCSLPSRDKKQSFLSLQYHRTVAFRQKDTELSSLIRDCNLQRKVVILPTIGGERIGLVQHCCSVLLVNRLGQEWNGMCVHHSYVDFIDRFQA